MSIEELMPALRDLNRAEKLRVMQFLVLELSRDEGILLAPGAEYPVWSPYDAVDAADALLKVLNAPETTRAGER